MKSVLIISPRFPPINAPDVHRVRQSLPYFREAGWDPHVLAVDPAYVHRNRDELLLETIPSDVRIDRISALPEKWTRLLGVGSLGLRSLGFYFRAGSRILGQKEIDLIYFSTTAFPVMILGRYWKYRYDIPYVIDMQDPWRLDYFLNEPTNKRPPKFWGAYGMHRILEPVAMNGVEKIISVSRGYCDLLTDRYESISPSDCTVIPFGTATTDFDVLDEAQLSNPFFDSSEGRINVVYVGRGGEDMTTSARGLFKAFARGLSDGPELFDKIHMFFVGTSYAKAGKGVKTFAPLANSHGVADYVTEKPARVGYFQALNLMCQADMLTILGSDDPNYTASKLYPYILSRTPLLAIFNQRSSVVDILRATRAGRVVSFSQGATETDLAADILQEWQSLLRRLPYTPEVDWKAFEPYTAQAMTRRQVRVFNDALG